jgi:plasmid stabilization system protein ParE
MNLEYHPDVQRDVNDIIAYYEREGSADLADRFFTALQRSLAQIAEHPERSPPYHA